MVVKIRGQIFQRLKGGRKRVLGTGFDLMLKILFAEGIWSSDREGRVGLWEVGFGGEWEAGRGGEGLVFSSRNMFSLPAKALPLLRYSYCPAVRRKRVGNKNGDAPICLSGHRCKNRLGNMLVPKRSLNFRTEWYYVNAFECLGQGFPQSAEPVDVGVGRRWGGG